MFGGGCNMTYIAVRWNQSNAGYSIDLYSELSPEHVEIRKVELFADVRAQYADAEAQGDDTFLSDEPLPSLEACRLQ
jgi:hypothetical protein